MPAMISRYCYEHQFDVPREPSWTSLSPPAGGDSPHSTTDSRHSEASISWKGPGGRRGSVSGRGSKPPEAQRASRKSTPGGATSGEAAGLSHIIGSTMERGTCRATRNSYGLQWGDRWMPVGSAAGADREVGDLARSSTYSRPGSSPSPA
jgi:hypothetical protein